MFSVHTISFNCTEMCQSKNANISLAFQLTAGWKDCQQEQEMCLVKS